MMHPAKNAGNTVYVLYLLIKKLNIPVSFFTVQNDLPRHPDYPSMLALSDCLNSWKIPHEAFSIDKENDDIRELPFPFIANLKSNVREFVLIEKIEGDTVRVSSEREQKGFLRLSEFLKLWDGVVLYAEKDEKSGENGYRGSLIKGWLNKGRLPFLLLMLLCCTIYTLDFKLATMPYLALVLVKLAGLAVSSLLLLHSIDTNNPLLQNLCGLGKQNDCNAILKSDAAKLTNWLSWSEVGMFYFAGSLSYLLLQPSGIALLGWLNILCLPYTVYSIGYQARLKNWCTLCCTVQAFLWAETLVLFAGGELFGMVNPGFSDIKAILLCFLMPVAIWAFVKPFLLKAEQLNPLHNQLKRFKYNSTLFNQLLSAQPRYAVPNELMPVKLGNPDAEIVITMVSNPFCGPCGKAHRLLNEWLEHRDDIQIKVLFTTPGYDDIQAKVTRHVMALGLLEDRTIVERALNDWYKQSGKNYESWAEKYPVSKSEDIETASLKQIDWCKMAEVSFTPTIFINGYKLVDPYRLDDIKYLLST